MTREPNRGPGMRVVPDAHTTQVISITKRRDEQLVAMLEFFLEHAKRGELRGAAVFGEDLNGREEMCVAGDYRDRPARGAAAALRVAQILADMDGQCTLLTPPRGAR
jgi:hypothetical protein